MPYNIEFYFRVFAYTSESACFGTAFDITDTIEPFCRKSSPNSRVFLILFLDFSKKGCFVDKSKMSPTLLYASRAVAKISTTFFAANSLFTNTVQHPARMKFPTSYALTEWRSTFQRIGVQQASLAFISLCSGLAAYYYEPDNVFLSATLLSGSVIPWTILFLGPVNKRLNDPNLDQNSTEAKELLEKWHLFHTYRTIAMLAATFIWEYYW